ncbi:MAG: hypothetical protein RR202_08360 [Bacteroidales bacterium]
MKFTDDFRNSSRNSQQSQKVNSDADDLLTPFERRVNIMRLFKHSDFVTSAQCAEVNQCLLRTAQNDLKELILKGEIVRETTPEGHIYRKAKH